MPFIPSLLIDGAAPKGFTFGTKLSVQNYSTNLKDLVQACLYEKPAHRPNLIDLKTRIRHALDADFAANGSKGEPWEDFEMPQPGAPPPIPLIVVPPVLPPPERQGNPIAPAMSTFGTIQLFPGAVKLRRCTAWLTHHTPNRFCGLSARTLPDNPRCRFHQDRTKWP